MKKAAAAMALLAAMAAVSMWNVDHAEALTGALLRELELAGLYMTEDDPGQARAAVDRAMERWVR